MLLLPLIVSLIVPALASAQGLPPAERARIWCHARDFRPVPPVDIDAVLAGGPAGRRAADVDRPDAVLFRAMVDEPGDATSFLDAARCLAFKEESPAALKVLARALEIASAGNAGAPGRPAAAALWTAAAGAPTMPALRGGGPQVRPVWGATGIVFVELRVDREGKVRNARVVGWVSPYLERNVLTAVRNWSFDPTHVDGKPVDVTAVVPIRLTPGPEPSSADAIDTARYWYGQRQYAQAAAALSDAMVLLQRESEAHAAYLARQTANGIVTIDERGGGTIPRPTPTKQVEAEYPPIARAARMTGTARVEALIGQDGKVLEVKPVSGLPPLTDAALDAVAQWEFAPTIVDGKPVAVRMVIAIQFQ
jgi:protein TonB